MAEKKTMSIDEAFNSMDDQSTPTTPPPPQPTMLQRAGTLASDFGKGLGESAVSLMSTGDEFARKHLPAFLTNSNLGFGPPANLEHVHELATPANPTQAVGKGVGNAAQFLIPGGAEEKLATLAPEGLQTAARIGLGALSSGAVNKAQGGSFGAGAGAGATGGVLGAGMRAVAPKIAESALGITKADRAFSRTPGRAILDETTGLRPETIAESAQSRLNELTPQLESAVDRASARPTPIRGLLPAPTEEIPLHATGGAEPAESPRLFPAEKFPQRNIVGGVSPRVESELGSTALTIPGRLQREAYMSGSAHPELSGEIPTPQGVLRRPFQVSNGAPIAPTVPNRVFSLQPTRDIVSGAMGKASRENAASLHGQLGEMQDFLGHRFNTGEEIPSELTPREGLDLKRGFSTEFLGRWNPETHGGTLSTGRNAYHALDEELDRAVPEASGLNSRISNLIPIAHRAESVSRNAPTSQLLMRRIAAPTGALLGPIAGYHAGGIPGAIFGGVAPLLVTTPEGQMLAARGLNAAEGLKPAVGGLLQMKRSRDRDQTESQ